MDHTVERESIKPERNIFIGQEFPLFGPESIIPTHLGINEISNKISLFDLNINDNLRFPLDVTLHRQGGPDPTIAFTPFEPELGYVTSPEDYNPETRKSKLERILNKTKLINYSQPPFNMFFLEVGNNDLEDLNRIGINKKVYLPEHGSENQKQNLVKKFIVMMRNVAILKKFHGLIYSPYYQFPPETLDIIKKLRLLLSFPTGSFAAKPNEINLYLNGALTFSHFYPSDRGPFPKIPETSNIYQGMFDGHFIFVPTNLKGLSQIRAKFVLVDGQSQ